MARTTLRTRQAKLWLLLFVLQLCILELVLSVYFFHRRSEYPSAIIHYAVFTYQRMAIASRKEPLGIFEGDSKFGYRHLQNSTGNHRSASFDVTYTIGSDRERPIPEPKNPQGRILFLGSSFTFGYGVEDNENYPYLLATEHWANWQVVNKAVNGWSTVHAYMLLDEELMKSRPPTFVIYNTIPDHVCRNYLRPAWLKMLAMSQRTHPHFELLEGRPVFQRVVSVADAVHDEGALRRKELDLTAAFVRTMHNRAAEKGVRFIVVLLPQRFEVACGPATWPPSLIQSLTKEGVALLDLSEVKGQMKWLEHDAHPNREGHRVLAAAIAQSFISETLRDAVSRRGPQPR